MNLTRERIRQVEVKALAKLEALRDMMALRDYVDEGPIGKRRLPTLSNAELKVIDAKKAAKVAQEKEPSSSEWEEQSSEFGQTKPVDVTLFEG